MRNLKKLFAIGLSTVMLISSSVMAFAGNTNFSGDVDSSKTVADWQVVDPDLFSTADVEIQKGSGTDSWKMTSGGEGEATFVNTTTTTKLTVTLQDGASLEGVTVNAYQLLETTQEKDGKFSYTLADENLREFFATYAYPTEADVVEVALADDAYIMDKLAKIKEDATNAAKVDFAKKLQAYIKEKGITAVATKTGTAENNTSMEIDVSRQYNYSYNGGTQQHVYSGGKGYYFITRSDAIDDTYSLKVLNGDDSLQLKGSKLDLKKTGNKVVMEVGGEVEYTLESKMVYTGGDTTYKYIIYDRLEETMSADMDSFDVKVSTTGESPVVTGLVKDTDYTVEKTQVEVDAVMVDVIAITFKFDAASKLYNDAHLGETVTVTYTATMTGTATSGNASGNENYNKAWLEYGDEKTTEKEWDVYTLGMKITKTNESGAKLAGAEFNLYPTADDPGTALNFAKNEEEGYYYLSETGTATLVTDANGLIDIRGLDKGIYKLVETKAPDGYQTVDPAVITVTVTEDDHTDEFSNLEATIPAETTYAKITGANDSDGYINLTIMDPTQGSSDLPATGGVGRIFIYVIGSLILIGGCAAFVITRKKSA